jgi:uncharacterized protein (TIGR02246 family)
MQMMGNRRAWLLLGLLAVAGCKFEVGEAEDLEGSVEDMLQMSAAAWNRGDIDGFLDAYADAPSTSFMTPTGPVQGLAAIRTVYASAFGAGAARDSLRFEALRVRTISPLMAVVTGRYVLERTGSITSNGWFTLVLRRMGEGWRIVHDHSSESPLPQAEAPAQDATPADPEVQ